METIYNKIDTLTNRIDSEFIKLWDCAENNLEYKFFDFFAAMDQLVELLKRYSLTENYKHKLEEYYLVMVELFQQEEKVIFTEYIDKNDDLFQVTVKHKTSRRNTIGLDEKIDVWKYDEYEYNYAFKNFTIEELNKNENKSALRLNLHSVLQGKCQSKQQDFNTEVDELFLKKDVYQTALRDEVMKQNNYSFPLYSNLNFADYVWKLKKESLNLNGSAKINIKREDEIIDPPFHNIYSSDINKLGQLWKRSNKVLICSKEDYLYWFGGIGEKGKQIKWIKKKGARICKSALYQYCLRMNPCAKASMIDMVFDIKIETKNNTAKENAYPDINSIFN